MAQVPLSSRSPVTADELRGAPKRLTEPSPPYQPHEPRGVTLPQRRLVPSLWLSWCVVLGATSCEAKRDRAQACLEARREITELVHQGHADEARAQMEAYAVDCQGDSTYDLDRWRRTLDRQRRHEAQSKRHTEQEQRAEVDHALADFLAWAASLREAHDKHIGKTVCEPPTSEAFGLCTSQVHKPNSVRRLRHWKLDPSIFKFETRLNGPLHCQHLGVHREVARWNAGSASLELCEPLEHGLKGTQVLLENRGKRSTVHLFSKSYPAKDPAFEQRLRR